MILSDTTGLSKGSHKKVICQCDRCGQERELPFYAYHDLCKHCSYEFQKGENNPNYGKGLKGENNPAWKGRYPICIDCGKLLSKRKAKRCRKCAKQGKHHSSYKHNHTDDERWLQKHRSHIPGYYLSRKQTKQRDNYTCRDCGYMGKPNDGTLVSHHIKSYAEHKELRTDANNIITLCKHCHKEIHKRKTP